MIITYGTSFIYEFLPKNQLVANCHKIPQKFFHKRLLTDEELKNSITETIENLKDILEAYQPNEILFSTEDLSTQFIIETMSNIKESIVFRLVTKNRIIISSTSKNTTGEIYSFDINLSADKSWLDKLRNWI